MSSFSISSFCKMELKLHSHDFDRITPYAGVCTAFPAFVSCRLSSKLAWFIRPLLCSSSIANFSSFFLMHFGPAFPNFDRKSREPSSRVLLMWSLRKNLCFLKGDSQVCLQKCEEQGSCWAHNSSVGIVQPIGHTVHHLAECGLQDIERPCNPCSWSASCGK